MAAREAEIKDQMKALKAELREIQIAKAAVATEANTAAVIGAPPALPTIKEMARAVLAEAKAGATSGEILGLISLTYGREVERTSLSPQLSRLKDDGELVLSGEKWFTKANYAAWEAEMLREATRQIWEGDAPANAPADDVDDGDWANALR